MQKWEKYISEKNLVYLYKKHKKKLKIHYVWIVQQKHFIYVLILNIRNRKHKIILKTVRCWDKSNLKKISITSFWFLVWKHLFYARCALLSCCCEYWSNPTMCCKAISCVILADASSSSLSLCVLSQTSDH